MATTATESPQIIHFDDGQEKNQIGLSAQPALIKDFASFAQIELSFMGCGSLFTFYKWRVSKGAYLVETIAPRFDNF